MMTEQQVRLLRAECERTAQDYADQAARRGFDHALIRHLFQVYESWIARVDTLDAVLQEDAGKADAWHRIRFPFEVSTL